MFPKQGKVLFEVYRAATLGLHGYLLIDLHEDTPEHLRLRTNIFPFETQIVYVPKIQKEASLEQLHFVEMASSRVQKNANSLYVLAKSDPELRKAIVKGCKRELIR